MSRLPRKLRRLALPLLAAPLMSGCVLLSDAVNPNLLTQIGLDPNTIFPSAGTVIVVFNNQTQFPVTFYVYQAQEPSDLAVDGTNVARLVDPNTTRNSVLDCPLGVISPGVLDANFEPQTLAATVFNGQGTDVDYLGAALISGRDFTCGDVIEIRVIAAAAGDQQDAFAVAVRVLPGT